MSGLHQESEQTEIPGKSKRGSHRGRSFNILFWFDQNGKMVEAKTLRSPHEILSEAALDTVRQWRFEPHAPLYPDAHFNAHHPQQVVSIPLTLSPLPVGLGQDH